MRCRRRRAVHVAMMIAVAVTAALPNAWAVDLVTAFEAARAEDPTVAAARAAYAAALQGVEVAGGRLLPQVTFQSTQQVLDQTTVSSTGTALFDGHTRSTVIQGRLGIYRKRDRVAIDIAGVQAEQAALKVQGALADLFARTAGAWVDAVSANTALSIYRQASTTAGAIAQQARARFAAGEGTRDAVSEADAQQDAARLQVREAELDFDAKRRALTLVTRLPDAGLADRKLPESGLADAVVGDPALLGRVLDSNADIAAARLEERLGELRVSLASADHHPTLDVIAGHTEAESDSTNTLGARYRNNAVGLQLVVPIFSGFSVDASVRQAVLAVETSRANTRALVQRVESQFLADAAMLGGLGQRLTATTRLIEAAVESRKAVDAGFVSGLRSLVDVSAAEQQITRRQLDRLGVQSQQAKAMVRLLALLPGGDDELLRWARAVGNATLR